MLSGGNKYWKVQVLIKNYVTCCEKTVNGSELPLPLHRVALIIWREGCYKSKLLV